MAGGGSIFIFSFLEASTYCISYIALKKMKLIKYGYEIIENSRPAKATPNTLSQNKNRTTKN